MKRINLVRMVFVKSICVLSILCLISCSTSQKYIQQDPINTKVAEEYEIHSTKLLSENDTVYIDEIRYYEIRSALDAMFMMYDNYGEFDERLDGKYQSNIRKAVWKNVDLMGDGKKYFVIADGTETMEDYFASLMVFDENKQNCLSESYPNREEIIKFLIKKMRKSISKKKRNDIYQKL